MTTRGCLGGGGYNENYMLHFFLEDKVFCWDLDFKIFFLVK